MYVGGIPQTIHIQADGSPVTGVELFGVIYDLVLRDTIERCMMPGTTLSHGHCRLVDKVMTVLWLVFLVAGPSEETMRFWLDSVESLNTDFGTESGLADVPDLLPLFFHWLLNDAGPLPLIVQGSFLFPDAMGVAGWNHLWSNLVKAAFNTVPGWPEKLRKLRSLCSFLRIKGYSEVIARVMRNLNMFDVAKHVEVFYAGFFKIRWETMALVLFQLNRIFPIRFHMTKEVFGDVQERSMLKEFLVLCKDDGLWYFIMASEPFARYCDHGRKWGLACPCHEEGLLRGESIERVHKSRRLHEAWPFICRWCVTSYRRASLLRLEDCSGDVETHAAVAHMYRFVPPQLKQTTYYIRILPWYFAMCDNQEAAGCVLAQWGVSTPGATSSQNQGNHGASSGRHHRIERHWYSSTCMARHFGQTSNDALERTASRRMA